MDTSTNTTLSSDYSTLTITMPVVTQSRDSWAALTHGILIYVKGVPYTPDGIYTLGDPIITSNHMIIPDPTLPDPSTIPDTINTNCDLPAAPLVPEYIYIPEDVDDDDLSGGTGIYLYDN